MSADWNFPNARRLAFLLLVALLLQPLRGISDHGLDLVLVLTALAGLRMTVFQAAAWGMAAGLLQDLCSVNWWVFISSGT